MQKLRNHLVLIAALGTLGAMGWMMNVKPAAAQPPPPAGSAPVTIVGPLPLSVTGVTTVSGVVAAAQSGTWNVAITGNSAASPLSTKNVDEPGRNPYQERLTCNVVAGNAGRCTAQGLAVPANKRLVIEHVSAQLVVDTGRGIEETELGSPSFQQFLSSRLENFNIPGSRDTYYVNDRVLLYLEAGEQPTFRAKTATFSAISINATISGYFINLGI